MSEPQEQSDKFYLAISAHSALLITGACVSLFIKKDIAREIGYTLAAVSLSNIIEKVINRYKP